MQRIKFSFTRNEKVKFLSHLDIMRAFHRVIRRAGIPVAYSQGFNPQLRMSIALPLPLGVTSENEIAELYLDRTISPAIFVDDFNSQLPEGFSIINATEVLPEAPPLMQKVNAALYKAFPLPGDKKIPEGILPRVVEEIKNKEELIVKRTGKKGTREIDIRPFVYNIEVITDDDVEILKMFLQTGSLGGARPLEVLKILGELGGFDSIIHIFQIHRIGLFHKNRDSWELIE